MPKTTKMSIRCQHCQKLFPSPILFKDDKSFDTSTLCNNQVQCDHCGAMTGCDKENILARYDESGKESGFVGKAPKN